MGALIPGLEVARHLPGERTLCSWAAGWRALVLRGYREPRVAAAFTIPATADQAFVLVTGGACAIEAREGSRWRRARYRTGSLALTPPGREMTLRWRGPIAHATLQLHLPAATLEAAAAELSERDPAGVTLPSVLAGSDALIAGVMRGMVEALEAGAPDLYAETAGDLLAMHLLVRHGGLRPARAARRRDRRLDRAEALMRAELSASLSLQALAEAAGVSRHHLLRLYREAYGETPLKRLTRLRMERARRLLARGDQSVTAIADRCGYANPSHFATAFRRVVGVSPRAYRRDAR